MWKLCYEYEQRTKGIIYHGIKNNEENIDHWLNTQKQIIKGNQNVKMDNERLNKLFVLITIQKWYVNLTKDSNWTSKCELCIEYESLNNSINYTTITPNGDKIGQWFTTQIQAVKGRNKCVLNETRLKQLLNSRTFYEWYINHQNECLPQFQGFHLLNNQ